LSYLKLAGVDVVVAAAVVVFKWDRVVSLVTDVGQNIGCSEGA
jgi:hypothetical protein